jgi:Subtilase family/Secretion system C-terminal sorting domain
MNGNTTIISKAADLAAKKGMLIVVAAGNEGNSAWRYISAPADADSVMAVGAVNVNGVIGSFSSYGPSSDGQIKPSVSAVGVSAVVANSVTGLPNYGSGTSFACPNMAGLSTCLWQAFPEVNNMAIINTLQQAANNANTPNDRVGYGIPDMKKAFVLLIKQLFTQQITITNCKATISWAVKTDSAITLQIERKLPTDLNYSTIYNQNSTGAFALQNFSFVDDLSSVNSNSINYRIKMNIAADTSFYFDVVTLTFTPKPNLGADKSISKCADSAVNLTSLFVNQGTTNLWTMNGVTVTNPSAVSAAGNYQLISTSNSGCADTAIAAISFIARPNLGADKIVEKCIDSSFNLTNQFNTIGLQAIWKTGNTIVPNPLAVANAGVYQLIATNISGCADTATVTINTNEQLCPKPSISPNPATDILKITVLANNAAAKVEIVIYNATGQRVYNSTQQQTQGAQTYTVPVKNLATGIYNVIVFSNGNKYMMKKVLVSKGN